MAKDIINSIKKKKKTNLTSIGCNFSLLRFIFFDQTTAILLEQEVLHHRMNFARSLTVQGDFEWTAIILKVFKCRKVMLN